jgi:hypothetical protein
MKRHLNLSASSREIPAYQEMAMAKGQQRSNREAKKPKAEKPKPAAATSSFTDKKAKPKAGK